MRLTVTNDEVIEIITALSFSDYERKEELIANIKSQLYKPIKKSKRDATINATKTKVKATKDKIQNAVNLMRLEGEKATAYSVAKKANVSYNSAKKYSYLFQTD